MLTSNDDEVRWRINTKTKPQLLIYCLNTILKKGSFCHFFDWRKWRLFTLHRAAHSIFLIDTRIYLSINSLMSGQYEEHRRQFHEAAETHNLLKVTAPFPNAVVAVRRHSSPPGVAAPWQRDKLQCCSFPWKMTWEGTVPAQPSVSPWLSLLSKWRQSSAWWIQVLREPSREVDLDGDGATSRVMCSWTGWKIQASSMFMFLRKKWQMTLWQTQSLDVSFCFLWFELWERRGRLQPLKRRNEERRRNSDKGGGERVKNKEASRLFSNLLKVPPRAGREMVDTGKKEGKKKERKKEVFEKASELRHKDKTHVVLLQ